MAHYTTMDGIGGITGALSKRKTQGVEKMMITRVKSVKDPLTGEVVGQGPQEMTTLFKMWHFSEDATETCKASADS